MDIQTDLASVAQRISEITGAPVQVPGLPANDSGNTASFASLVQSALANSNTSVPGAGSSLAADSAVAGARAIVPPEQIQKLVGANAAQFGVDPALIKAIIANESGFNANATSSVGAQGLMQLMPGTASGLGVTNAYDPAQNVWGGTKYIKGLLDRFNGDPKLAVAAYNAGPGAVEKYNGVPPYAETQNYVQNVLASYQQYRSQGQ